MIDSAFRCGTIAIVGRPNVGKSTLMNGLIGQKISITSPKPQTTRHRIHGILTLDEAQLVFVDTPGIHLNGGKALNRVMNRTASSALEGVDVVMMLVEAGRFTDEDARVAQLIANVKVPVVLVINKVDKIQPREKLLPYLAELGQKVAFTESLPISAYDKKHKQLVINTLIKHLPEGEAMFDEDMVTDASSRFLAAEMVREKLMRRLEKEIPYGLTVEIEKYEVTPERVIIDALILVEREGQKRIVIGEGGGMLKQVGSEARQDLMRMLDSRVHLQLWVKVKDNWSDDERALASLGYQ
ncbi:MAG: GTPase Era [Gammaproteobacteria bacterium]|nr:GTPase Era [Gammaproteobacteria bacterium]MCL5797008.1 GTPase Era [Gammaproteobacteria bacterium]OYZ09042.1 MAG: GTPase Era [Thiotrichales bacterium 16-46-22]HQT01479.1 GTPase Era [Thiotrichales bacterium]HQT03907.1 GTPase Era [Thiotrichales bacterium]